MSPIVRIAARGEGVSADGRFAPLAAPGDMLADDGHLVAGPDRVTPPCRHFPACGGCQLQHVGDAAYADYLVARIADALKAQGIAPPPFAVPHLSPPRTRRRATMRAERRGRTVLLGFNEAGSNRIVDMRECHVLLPELFALVASLRGLLAGLLLDRARATITVTRVDQGVDLLLAGVAAEGLDAVEALTAFGDRHRLARLSLDEGFGPQTRYQPEKVTVTFAGVPVELPDGAFLQATADGERALVASVQTAIGDVSAPIDLFAGLGTFALAVGAKLAVEGSRDAAAALLATRRVAVEHRDLFRRPLTSAELTRFDAAILDPPRSGAIEQVKQLAGSGVPRVAYVSCNPATFARDARLMIESGYALEHVTPVGQFRWSTHVELSATFVRT